jgi:putative flippase GtrA
MSVRRVLDAGLSAWLALLFFVPVVNYLLMLLLSVLPHRAPREHGSPSTRGGGKIPSAILSIGVGVGVDVGMFLLSVYGLRDYGVALFVGTPFVASAIASYIFNRRYVARDRETIQLGVLTMLVAGGVMFAFGFEGGICLLMALPLGIGLSVLGAILGGTIAVRDSHSSIYSLFSLVLLSPSSLHAPQTRSRLHEVRSSIEIDAPPEIVWSHVIAFPPLPAPSSFVQRLGLAYPVRARIVGAGIGATRYCEFSTGAFVEPIRVWEPGLRLAFDVTHSPPPLREWSPYAHVVPPHLDGYFRARRGEFRLVRLTGNRTRLEGSTWYELRIGPEAYWTLYADLIVKRIHHRVLAGIAEGQRTGNRGWGTP